jgi:arylsulfatase A-like enzyme
MPSRSTIATGLYEYRTGCNFEHGRMQPETFEQSFYVQLRNAGYFTGYAGKFGFGLEQDTGELPVFSYHRQDLLPGDKFDWWKGQPGQANYNTSKNQGLEHLAEEYPHLTRALGKASGEFFGLANDSGKPFCLTIGFKAPHDPPTPDPYFYPVYARTEFPKAGNYGPKGAEHLSKHIQTGRQWVEFKSWDEDVYNEAYRKYFQLILGLDHAVGMVRDALRENGQEQNTVIIFTSDNGYFCGSHRFGDKVLLYEEGSHVPMIIYDPRHPSTGKGIRVESLSANIDIAPTILDLAGLDPAENIDGTSLLPLLDDSEENLHHSINLVNLWNMPPTQCLAVTNGRFKYIYYWYEGEGLKPTEELYDLRQDPLEMQNLALDPNHEANLERMQKFYDEAVVHIKEHAVDRNRYEHYGLLLDRNISWQNKKETYAAFFDMWLTTLGSWRGGKWFEDLDLSAYAEDVLHSYGKPK